MNRKQRRSQPPVGGKDETMAIICVALNLLSEFSKNRDERFLNGAGHVLDSYYTALETGERPSLPIGELVDEVLAAQQPLQ